MYLRNQSIKTHHKTTLVSDKSFCCVAERHSNTQEITDLTKPTLHAQQCYTNTTSRLYGLSKSSQWIVKPVESPSKSYIQIQSDDVHYQVGDDVNFNVSFSQATDNFQVMVSSKAPISFVSYLSKRKEENLCAFSLVVAKFLKVFL